MLSKTLLSASLIVLAAVSPGRAQAPRDFHPNLAFLRSPHADGAIAESRALQALWCAASELNVPPEKLPRIIVVHGGRDVGAIAGIHLWNSNADQKSSGAVVTQQFAAGDTLYYLWVIGKPSDEVLAMGFVRILRPEALLPESELIASAKRVLVRMSSTVNVNDLQKVIFAHGPRVGP